MLINHMPPSNVLNIVFQKLFVHDFNKEGQCIASLGFLAKQFRGVIENNDNTRNIIYRNDSIARLFKWWCGKIIIHKHTLTAVIAQPPLKIFPCLWW